MRAQSHVPSRFAGGRRKVPIRFLAARIGPLSGFVQHSTGGQIGTAEMVNEIGTKIATTRSLSHRQNLAGAQSSRRRRLSGSKAPPFAVPLLDSDHGALQKFIVHPLA